MKASVTISKRTTNNGTFMCIALRDQASFVQFAEFTMSMEDFCQAITGLAECKGELQVRHLEAVGKTLERKPLKFEIPENISDAKEWAEKNCHKYADDGWTADGYYRSQSSIQYDNSGEVQKRFACGSQKRYV